MIEIKIIDSQIAKEYKNELTKYLFLCLNNSFPKALNAVAEKYYEDFVDFLQCKSAIAVGAFEDDLLIGFQWTYEINVMGQRRLHSSFDCVQPGYQGEKIGTQMMQKIEEIALEKGIYEIEAMCSVINENAVQYHLHNGFEVERFKMVKKLKD